jgi:hypothetical protein
VCASAVKTWKTSTDPQYALKKARVEHLYAIADADHPFRHSQGGRAYRPGCRPYRILSEPRLRVARPRQGSCVVDM